MLNQVAVEALYSATYVENYLDSVENLPDDMQRHLSRIRDIDVQYRSHLRDVDYYYEQWRNSTNSENSSSKRIRSMARVQQCLIAAQELGDEKLQIVNQLQELIDHKTRQLDVDFKNLDYGKEDHHHHHHHHHHNTSDTLLTQQQKLVRPPSPSNMSSNPNNIKIETVTSAFSSSIQHQRVNTPTTNQSSMDRSSNTTNSGSERSTKRSRRPRNDISSMDIDGSGSNTNSLNENQKQNSSNQSCGVGGVGGGGTSTSQKKSTNATNKKKKRKAKNNQSNQSRDARDDTPPPEETIDPDEPTYCLCDQISFGEMILCDNDLCPIEWFHFSCVALMSKPKGKWFCPNCRGDRPNVMKPKAQFLKELERYNKEKEEKT